MVLMFGLVSNAIVTGFAVLSMICNKENCASSHAFVWIGISIQQIVQFILLLIFRFSHGGKVCSGDYLNEVTTNSSFYMIGLGKFLFIYSMSWIFITAVALTLLLCCGGCVYGQLKGGYANVEDGFSRMVDPKTAFMAYATNQNRGPQGSQKKDENTE